MSVSCVTTCTGGTAEAGAAAEEVVATDMTVAAEAAGAVSATALSSTRCATPALSGNRCRPPASQERDSAGSHHEDQLLGTRGPPTASSSTGFRELPRRLRIVPLYRVAVASFALIGYTLYTSHEKDTTAPK